MFKNRLPCAFNIFIRYCPDFRSHAADAAFGFAFAMRFAKPQRYMIVWNIDIALDAHDNGKKSV